MSKHKNSQSHETPLRIGLYAGAFDPVHSGHVAFALQALEAGNLDEVVFMPERRPRGKPGVEHYAHRVVMLKKALRPHPRLAVMETVDRHYTVARTLPQLRQLYRGARLVFLLGSDAVLSLPNWPHAGRLLRDCELIVGVRSEHQHEEVAAAIENWDIRPAGLRIVDSFAPDVSSERIRHALRENIYTKGLLDSVSGYARQEWLYVSPSSITQSQS